MCLDLTKVEPKHSFASTMDNSQSAQAHKGATWARGRFVRLQTIDKTSTLTCRMTRWYLETGLPV